RQEAARRGRCARAKSRACAPTKKRLRRWLSPHRSLCRQTRLERQTLRQRQFDALDDRALCQPDGLSGLSEDLARERLCLTVEAIAGDDALDEAVAVGSLRVDWVAGEYHRHRDPGRHVAAQGLRSAGRRDVAEADFGEAESD